MRAVAMRRRAYRRYQIRRNVYLLATVIFALIMMSILLTVKTQADSSKGVEPVTYKYYTSIQIQQGDTLESIAAQYMSGEFDSTQAYVDELVTLNGLTSDTIHAGEYITVPYYSADKY